MLKGVITGDLVGSTSIKPEALNELRNAIVVALRTRYQKDDETPSCEFYRGDSVQILCPVPEDTVETATLLRATIKSQDTEKDKDVDIRFSIGIGAVTHMGESLATSDGKAFLLSGHGLDNIGKKRLEVLTPWQSANDELQVTTAFLDAVITGWTKNQAEAVRMLLLYPDKTQKEISEEMRSTEQNISKLLKTANYSLVQLYLKRFRTLISNHSEI